MKIFGPPYTRGGGKFFSLLVTSTKVNPGLDPTGELLCRTAGLHRHTAGLLDSTVEMLVTSAGPLGTTESLGIIIEPLGFFWHHIFQSPLVMSSGPALLGHIDPTSGAYRPYCWATRHY